VSDDAAKLVSGEAWREWCDRLKAIGEEILGDAFPPDPRGRAEGFRALTRLLIYATQQELEAGDPQFPSFVRHQDPRNQWGGPNPDNVYLRANIDPACTYRVWADVTGVRQAILSLHEGDMQLEEYGVYNEHSLDRFEVGPDGRLELWISPEERPGNWIPMHPKARIFTIRIYQSDWERDAAPPFHIVRVGAEGVPRPPLDPAFVTRALDRAATWVERSAVYWNRYTGVAWERATPNVVTPARSASGGADNILYGSCFWELAEDEALLICCEEPEAEYWGFSIHTLAWLESGDFADRQTSLSGHQVHVDDDGRVRVVLAHHDPGVPNWIDTEGRPRGMLAYRWVWAQTRPVPQAQVVKRAELRTHLPENHPVVDVQARRGSLARRREAAWSRFL
jgi:hypothetical protein